MERAAAVKFARSGTFSYLEHAGTLRPFVHLFTRVCLLFQSVCAASGRFTRSSTQFTGGACEFSTWGTCLPSPPEAFLGDPLLSGCEPFSPFWGPPLSKKDLSLP